MSTQSKRKTSKPLPKTSSTKKIKTAEKTPSESVTKSINQETKQMSGVCQRLTKAFFEQPSYELAKALLGKILVRKIDGHLLKCRIVETELYPGGDDKGSVSYNDRCTPANEPVFMPAGTMWVYMTYGMYHLINISSGDHGGAVLLRAGEPLEDVDKMHELRLSKLKTKKPLKAQELCSGPAKLCTAMGIDKQTCNAQNVTECNELWFEESENFEEQRIVSAKRIGID